MKHVRSKFTDNYIRVSPTYEQITKHLSISPGTTTITESWIYPIYIDPDLNENEIAFTNLQAQEIHLAMGDPFQVEPYPDPEEHALWTSLILTIRPQSPRHQVFLDLETFTKKFLKDFNKWYIFPGQSYFFYYDRIICICRSLSDQPVRINPKLKIDLQTTSASLKMSITAPRFSKKNEETSPTNNVFIQNQPNFNLKNFDENDLKNLGIGGLHQQFKEIMRRIFSSRLVDPTLAQKLNIKHVKGMILFGPPGTGKTLMSRNFSQLISSIEPVLVNGPEILNKFVGQSEENLRKLFEKAQNDKHHNNVHVIIFDEIDAICRSRSGGSNGTSKVGDSLVNQLLTLMDGVKSLENILVIGITNRKDLLDPALLRPGRFEVHLRIGLPDFPGRKEIFDIYLKPYHDENQLQFGEKISIKTYPDLLDYLAKATPNYSGAEISGVVKSAVSFAVNREIDWSQKRETVKEIHLSPDDLNYALSEIRPQWSGLQGKLPDPISGFQLSKDLQLPNTQTGENLIISGPVKSGKTQSLAHLTLALDDDTYVLYVNQNLEQAINSLEIVQPDFLIIDDLEDLVQYIPLGARYQGHLVLRFKQLLKGSIPIIATTSKPDVIEAFGLLEYFNHHHKLDYENESISI